MKYFISLLICGILCIHTTYGQSEQDLTFKKWHKGLIVLNSQKALEGKVKYNHVYDAVMLYADGKVTTYSPSQVDYFYYIQNESGVVFDYKSFPYESVKDGTYERKYFFEVLLDGEVLYLRKGNKKASFLENENIRKILPKLDVEKTCYDYFMLYNDNVVCINDFVDEAMPLLQQDYPNRIPDFITAKDIRNYTPHDKLVILHYYNTLQIAEVQPKIALQPNTGIDTLNVDPILNPIFGSE